MKSVFRMALADLRGTAKEQPSWRIAPYNIGELIRSRVIPFAKWVFIYFTASLTIAACFACSYSSIITARLKDSALVEQGVIEIPTYLETLRDSFLIFTNLPIFTASGQPRPLDGLADLPVNDEALLIEAHAAYQDILSSFSGPMLAERMLGVVVNAVLIAVITSIALQPINPIWLAPRFMLNTEGNGPGFLSFKYWIRYPEDKWLHRFVLTVRILSDEADRSIENKSETEYEITFRRIMRRGMCEFQIPLFDQDGKLLTVLGKMIVGRYGEKGKTYSVWDYEQHRPCEVKAGSKEAEYFAGCQINYRVAGSTADGYEVAKEEKYSIEDMLFEFAFMPAEVPEKTAEVTHEKVMGPPWAEDGKYRFFYRNVWKAVPIRNKKTVAHHPGIDMREISLDRGRIKQMLKYIEIISNDEGSQRPSVSGIHSNDIRIEKASVEDVEAIADLMRVAQDSIANKDFYVISSPDRVRWKLETNSFAFLAKDRDRIVGFYLFETPGLDDNENLGYDINLSNEELMRVQCMDSVAVLPEYRGLGLQRKMAKMGEEEGIRRGYDIFMATADPRNTPSVRNFILSGYDIVRIKESYYSEGVPRVLFLKRADGKKMTFPSVDDGLVLG